MVNLVQNIQALSSVKHPSQIHQELVPSFSGSHLYKSSSFWGWVYWGVYRFIRLIDWQHRLETSRFKVAMTGTLHALHEELKQLHEVSKKVERAIEQCMLGTSVECAFDPALERALSMVEKGALKQETSSHLVSLFARVVGKIPLDEEYMSLTLANAAAQYAVCKALKQTSFSSIKALGGILAEERLEEGEEACLLQFVDALKRALPENEKSLLFYRSFSSCTEAFLKRASLSERLSGQGRIWAYLKQRGLLESGLFNISSDYPMKMGYQLGSQRVNAFENKDIYSLEGEREGLEMHCFASSRFARDLEVYSRQLFVKNHRFLPAISEADWRGKLLIQEKVDHSLENHTWDIREGVLGSEDQQLMNSFFDLIMDMTASSESYPLFSKHSFEVTQEGELKFVGHGSIEKGQDAMSFFRSLQNVLLPDHKVYSITQRHGLSKYSWLQPTPAYCFFALLYAKLKNGREDISKRIRTAEKILIATIEDSFKRPSSLPEIESMLQQIDCWKRRIQSVYKVDDEGELVHLIQKKVLRVVQDHGFAALFNLEALGKKIVTDVVSFAQYPLLDKEVALAQSLFRDQPFVDAWKTLGGVSAEQFFRLGTEPHNRLQTDSNHRATASSLLLPAIGEELRV